MGNTEMIERITMGRRGTITIPAKMLIEFDLKLNSVLLAETTEQGILLRPANRVPY
jgi:bifunctional DNA-binding transcriptional regulator/antitoxin component of YhaV-PrlF toxin-antitoxin module